MDFIPDEKPKKISWRQSLQRRLDDLEKLVFPKARLTASRAAMEAAPLKASWMAIGVKGLAGICSIIFLLGAIWLFYFFATILPSVKQQDLVTDLGNPDFIAKYAMGDFQPCEASHSDCWLSPSFNQQDWQQISLPHKDVRQFPGFRKALEAKEWIVYRLELPVSDALRAYPGTVAFSPAWVNYEYFEVYLNGKLAYLADGITTEYSLVVLPIPKSDIAASATAPLSIVIRGKLSSSSVGMQHHGRLLLGPKIALDKLYTANERANFTYHLLFLFAKGSIFIIFTLFYMYTSTQSGFYYFLLYAFCVTLEPAIIISFDSIYLSKYNKVILLLYFEIKTIAILALHRFFLEFFWATGKSRYFRTFASISLLTITALLINRNWETGNVSIPMLMNVTNNLLIISLIIALGIGLLHLRLLRKMHILQEQISTVKQLLAFVSLYTTLVIWETYFNEFKGFDKRTIFDLLFFFYIALTSARNFGLIEGKVLTLEEHMQEKKRMEEELQEAAEIAKAFIPHSIPNWPFCDIAVYHKPISESSGDWFAFESSDSGELHHCILCDISGHGVQAALVVSTCKTTLSWLVNNDRNILEKEDFLLHYIQSLNKTLFHHGNGLHISTLLGLTFAPKREELYVITAGHPAPVLIERLGQENTAVVPILSRHSLLGIRPDFSASLEKHKFTPGDHIIAYTDGLPLNGKNVRRIDALQKIDDFAKAPMHLYGEVWNKHEKMTTKKPDDDVSIIWFKAN